MPHEISALVFDAYGTLFDVHSVSRLAESLYPGKGARSPPRGAASSSSTRGSAPSWGATRTSAA
jgi:FMN phosphatase YigB (HAD superfamily)